MFLGLWAKRVKGPSTRKEAWWWRIVFLTLYSPGPQTTESTKNNWQKLLRSHLIKISAHWSHVCPWIHTEWPTSSWARKATQPVYHQCAGKNSSFYWGQVFIAVPMQGSCFGSRGFTEKVGGPFHVAALLRFENRGHAPFRLSLLLVHTSLPLQLSPILCHFQTSHRFRCSPAGSQVVALRFGPCVPGDAWPVQSRTVICLLLYPYF